MYRYIVYNNNLKRQPLVHELILQNLTPKEIHTIACGGSDQWDYVRISVTPFTSSAP
jgi:hypothetical protein